MALPSRPCHPWGSVGVGLASGVMGEGALTGSRSRARMVARVGPAVCPEVDEKPVLWCQQGSSDHLQVETGEK